MASGGFDIFMSAGPCRLIIAEHATCCRIFGKFQMPLDGAPFGTNLFFLPAENQKIDTEDYPDFQFQHGEGKGIKVDGKYAFFVGLLNNIFIFFHRMPQPQ